MNNVDQGELSVTRFHVTAPPSSIRGLRRISSPGFAAGDNANASARQMYYSTDMTKREVKGVYCYLFSWYVQNGVVPTEPRQFEEIVLGYISGRVFPSTPSEKLRGLISLFRNSIVNAQSAGEASANVAVATTCSWPSR